MGRKKQPTIIDGEVHWECPKCKKQKTAKHFNASKNASNGLFVWCIDCRSADARTKRSAMSSEDRKAERERIRIWRTHRTEEQRQRHRESGLACMRRYNANHPHPERVKACSIFNYAITSGLIERGRCVKCGEENAHGHHPDYSKPLEVIWLCRIHHAEHHIAERELRRG